MKNKRPFWALIALPLLAGCPTRPIDHDAGPDRGAVAETTDGGTDAAGGGGRAGGAGIQAGGAAGLGGTSGTVGPGGGPGGTSGLAGSAGSAGSGTGGNAGTTGASGGCGSNTACPSGFCNLSSRQCVASQCQDGLQNGAETDVDCGGGTCPACAVNRTCATDTDCKTGSCSRLYCALASGPPNWLPGPPLNEGRAYMTVGMTVSGAAFQLYAFGAARSGIDPTTGDETEPNSDYEELYSGAQPLTWTIGGPLFTDIGNPMDAVQTNPMSWAVTQPNGDLLVFSSAGGWTIPYAGNFARTPTILVPSGNTALGAALGRDGLIYFVGWASYDPVQNVWSTGLPPPPTPRNEAAVVSDPDGLIYTIGGVTATDWSAAVEAYDPARHLWVTKSSLPMADRRLVGVTGPDGRIYTLGGLTGMSSGIGTVNAYTPTTNRWTSVAPLSDGRVEVGAVVTPDGHIWAIGGTPNLEVPGETTVQIYGPAVSIAPAAAQPGASVTVTGSNFAANATVHVFLGAATGQPIATGATNAAGNLVPPIAFTVPSLPAGIMSLSTVDDRSQYPITLQFQVQ